MRRIIEVKPRRATKKTKMRPLLPCPLIRGCLAEMREYLWRMITKKLLHVRYRVNDLEKAVRFYREILGLEEVSRKTSPRGSVLVFLKANESDTLLELCSYPSAGSVQVQPDLTHLAFEVDSLATFEKHLRAHGLAFSDGPTPLASGGSFAFIDAPEGYEIELIEPAR
jgi:lactoylglutathione lyase